MWYRVVVVVVDVLTCILGDAHQGMLGGRVLHDTQRWNEGAGGRHVDDYTATEVSHASATPALSRHLLLHDLADRLDEEQGALDVDVEKRFEFLNVCIRNLSRALHPNLEGGAVISLDLVIKAECNIASHPCARHCIIDPTKLSNRPCDHGTHGIFRGDIDGQGQCSVGRVGG